MRKICINVMDNSQSINFAGHEDWHIEDGLSIDFVITKKGIIEREYLPVVRKYCALLDWIRLEEGNFFFDLDKIKSLNYQFNDCSWIKGEVLIHPQIDKDLESNPVLCFSISREEIESKCPKKIFLSHKGSDKESIRQYSYLLKEIGYEPWLDEDAMVAGDSLHRSILRGFEESCACVFFITPQFKDESYLEQEIDYAVDEKMGKKERFSIITLQFQDEHGEIGSIPKLLKKYVCKKPKNQLEAFREIIKALPVKPGTVVWRR